MQESNIFIYIFKPKRENFLQTMTQQEMTAFGEHAEYTKKLFSEGKIIQMGRCLDGAYGIVVFKAESPEEAQLIYKNDPAVMADIVYAELHPYQVTGLQGY